MIKRSYFYWFGFLGLLLFRLIIINWGYHVDILSQAGWSESIYNQGALGFFNREDWILAWPTQPPLVNLLYGFDDLLYHKLLTLLTALGGFVAINHLGANHILWYYQFLSWFTEHNYLDLPYRQGLLITIKLPAILGDLGLALTLARFSKKYALIYLAIPYTWYLSSGWGQYDQLGYLFCLWAFLSVISKREYLSGILLSISVATKPTTLVFVPLLIVSWYYYKSRWYYVIGGLLAGIFIQYLTVLAFSTSDLGSFIHILLNKIFFKSEPRVSTNAFNFWRIIIGNQALGDQTRFLLIPANIWGDLAMAIAYLYALVLLAKRDYKGLFGALTVVGMASWLFMTNMLDRYFFGGLTSLLFLAIYKPELLKYWIVISLVFLLNLYNQWWFPNNLELLHQLLIWQSGLVSRVLALINVTLGLIVFWRIKPKPLHLSLDALR